jgi:hypothetical protein
MSTQIYGLQCKNLREREEKHFLNTHTESDSAFEDVLKNVHEGMTMSGRVRWQGARTVCVKKTRGARFTDFNGHTKAFRSISFELLSKLN